MLDIDAIAKLFEDAARCAEPIEHAWPFEPGERRRQVVIQAARYLE